MKKLLITTAALLVTLSLHAQGVINFQNDSTTLVNNAFKAGSPAVVTTDGIVAGLYWAPASGPGANVFVQIGSFAAVAPFPPGSPGRITAGTRQTTGNPGDAAENLFQVRAWEVAYGTTYELAIAAAPINGRVALRGTSNIFGVQTTSTAGNPPPTPNTLVPGLQSFAVNVPEPSTIALGLIGAGALLMLRRRK